MKYWLFLLFPIIKAFHIRFFQGSMISKETYQPFLKEIESILPCDSVQFQPYWKLKPFPPNTILMGHSFGGSMALYHSLIYSENIQGIVLLNSHFNALGQMPYIPFPLSKVKIPIYIAYGKYDQELPYEMVVIDKEETDRQKKTDIMFKEYESDHFAIFKNTNIGRQVVKDIFSWLFNNPT